MTDKYTFILSSDDNRSDQTVDMKKIKIIISFFMLTSVFFINSSNAESFDGTLDQSEDSEYKYYVCIGEDQDSESKAYKNAVNDCYQSAISDNFGISTQIQQSSVESDYQSKTKVKKNLISQKVHLKYFEKINQKMVKEQNFFKVYLKYKYLKSEIHKEQARLMHISSQFVNLDSDDEDSDTESSSSEFKYNTELIFRTLPSKAKIFIDGESMGYSNLNLKNILIAKNYKIKIEKEGFEDIDTEINLAEGQPQIFDIRLRPKILKLQFDIEPIGAQLFIDGKVFKSKNLWIESGKILQIKIENKNCTTQEFKDYVVDEKMGLFFEVKLKCRMDYIKKTMVPDDESPVQSDTNKVISLAVGVLGLGFVSGSSKLYRLTSLNSGYGVEFRIFNASIEYQESNFEKAKYEYVTNSMSDIKELVAGGQHRKIKIGQIFESEKFGAGFIYVDTTFKNQMPILKNTTEYQLTSIGNLKSYGMYMDIRRKVYSEHIFIKISAEFLITPVPSSEMETSFGGVAGLYVGF